ncbi:MAG: 4Fe-4S dicluster domain-containing protein [Acidobacteria bacterium]|nr:4Fe-4S dicluster domain-containing protein [Acidobacteriota bacterium]MBU1337648.1 4Fe-4S dicluster domain-containing protein [Acidobacteriota bacterium]MBU1475117.1 4Fe-4S dicluster domain-containing protein [Acidobacteriota bacterium]MBU2439166.1 4Fe-4S dicluster domain-containing protein [Acidobacteriota bacterium]
MRIVKLKQDRLNSFLEAVSTDSELWGPVKKGADKHRFKIVDNPAEFDLDYTRTILPPKKIFLPPRFNMFKAMPTAYEEETMDPTKKILFGVHPCDIHGILIMDQFYTQTYNDPYYIRSRENTIILGHSCWPDEHCLCHSTGTDVANEGYDLFFTALNDEYLVWIGSSKGDDLVRIVPELFNEDLSDRDIQNYIRWREDRSKAFKAEINFKAMPDFMELKYRDAVWENLSHACLACGSCSNVCPTCTCYNVNDKPRLSENASDIARCWDACTLESYSEVAGGENFRESRSERLKLYYTHKLQAFISKYGKPACVGCGRCAATCPVGINVKTVAGALDGEEVDAFWSRYANEVTK